MNAITRDDTEVSRWLSINPEANPHLLTVIVDGNTDVWGARLEVASGFVVKESEVLVSLNKPLDDKVEVAGHTEVSSMTKQQITPKGHEIPIPKRGDFFGNLKKATTPQKSGKRGPKQK
jgi:hypothetical protein